MNIEGNKIGGASLPDAHSIKEYIPNVVSSFKTPSFLVLSALQQQTNCLEVLSNQVAAKKMEDAKKTFHKIFAHHYQVAMELQPIPNQSTASMIWDLHALEKRMGSLSETNDPDFIYGQIVHLGEVLSTKIVSGYLNHVGLKNTLVDSRSLIVTDDNWKKAKVNMEETGARVEALFTKQFWSENPLVVMAGFIGQTYTVGDFFNTTLGREGSDTTAAILAYLLGVSRMNYWKDVDGLYTSNPKTDSKAKFIERASYEEVRKMKDEGRIVGLIHDYALDLLEEKGIIYSIRNTKKPTSPGTIIGA